jgi:hypothetical protein
MSSTTTSTAIVKIDRAPRYGKQLVSHLGRRSVGSWDETRAKGFLNIGGNEARVTITCTPDVLSISIAADASTIATVEDVLARHLKRFSARDAPDVHWTRSVP